jgi:hypothetical protein
MTHRSLLIEIGDDLLHFHDRLRAAAVARAPFVHQHLLHFLAMAFHASPSSEFQRRFRLAMALPIPHFTAAISALIIAVLVGDSPLFWRQISSALGMAQFKAGRGAIALIAGIVPHLVPGAFSRGVSLGPALLPLLETSDELTQQRILLALLALSEGSDFFRNHPTDTAALFELFATLSHSNLGLLQRALRLSVLAGGAATFIDSTIPRSPVEHFVTRECVFSAVGDRHIVVRHGLGATVFEVTALSDQRPTLSLLPDGPARGGSTAINPGSNSPSRPIVSSPYKCRAPADFSAALAELETSLAGADAFSSPPTLPRRPPISPARALLCDLGLIRATGERLVPASLADSLDSLDVTVAGQAVVVTVIDLSPSELPSPALSRLVQDLGQLTCPLWRVTYASRAVTGGSFKAVAARAGLVVLFDNSGLASPSELTGIDIAIIVSPFNDGGWTAQIVCNDPSVFGDEEISPVAVFIPTGAIGTFVTIIAFLFFATPGRSKNGCIQVKGPDQFMAGFYARCKQIGQIFERADPSRNAILVALAGRLGAAL